MILKSGTPVSGGRGSFLLASDASQGVIPVLPFLEGKVDFQGWFRMAGRKCLANCVNQCSPGWIGVKRRYDF